MSRIRLHRRITAPMIVVSVIAALASAIAAPAAVRRSGEITNAPGETAFRLLLQSHDGEDTTVIARPDHYEYAPSAVQLDETTIGMWFCGGGGSGALRGDSIFYSESRELGRSGTWTFPVEVVRPSTNNAYLDHGHACDPSVIQYGGFFYVMYTATPDWRRNPGLPQCPAPVSCDNRIFVARTPIVARTEQDSYQKLVNVGDCLDPACFQWRPFWSAIDTEYPPAAVIRSELAPVWRRQGSAPQGTPGMTVPYTTGYGYGQPSMIENGALRVWASHVAGPIAQSELWVRASADLADPFRLQDSASFDRRLSNTGNDVNYDVAFAEDLNRYVVNVSRDDLSDPSGRPCVHASHRAGPDTSTFSAPIMSDNLVDQTTCFLEADPSAHNSGFLRDPSGRLASMAGHAGGPAYRWVFFGTDLDKIAIDAGKFDILRTPFTLAAPPAPPAASARFTAVAPARLLDTRDGNGAPAGRLVPGQTLSLQVAGRAPGMPLSGASSVLLNITATDATAPGFVTVHPCGGPLPLASNLNFEAGQSAPNLVVARLDEQGRACLFTSAATHLVADIGGYHSADGSADGLFNALSPQRLLDTRTGDGAPAGKVGGGQTVSLPVAGRAGTPAGAAAVLLNVTSTESDGPGFVTAYPCETGQIVSSNLNYVAGQTVPNLVAARLDSQGRVCLYTSAPTHLVADIAGYYTPSGGSPFTSITPERVLDTRVGNGALPAKIGAGQTATLQVWGRAGVPIGATSAMLNVTATEPDAPGFITAYPCDTPLPVASNLNYVAGQSVPNLVAARLDSQGRVCLYTSAATHLVADIAGYFGAG